MTFFCPSTQARVRASAGSGKRASRLTKRGQESERTNENSLGTCGQRVAFESRNATESRPLSDGFDFPVLNVHGIRSPKDCDHDANAASLGIHFFNDTFESFKWTLLDFDVVVLVKTDGEGWA